MGQPAAVVRACAVRRGAEKTLALCKGNRKKSDCGISPSLNSPQQSCNNRQEVAMSSVRVLVGTHKGAFVLTSDGKRRDWQVSGPFFAGWEIYHVKGSEADPNRIYVSQTSGWFGQLIQRSDDGGK